MRSITRKLKTELIDAEPAVTHIGDIELEYEVDKNNKTIQKEKEVREMSMRKRRIRWMLSGIALCIGEIIYLFTKSSFLSCIPLVIHFALVFYTFAVGFYRERKEKQYWALYLKKYGVNGVVPEHVKMIHKKLIQNGEKIKV